MKRLEIWSAPLRAIVLIAACQAPDQKFFDRPFSTSNPQPATGAGTTPGTATDASDPLGPAMEVVTPSSNDSPSPSSTPSPTPPSDGDPSNPGRDVPPPIAADPQALPVGDEGAPGSEPPQCATEACATCLQEQPCDEGLVCHPHQGLCVTSCTSDDACEVASTPICGGNDEGVLGVCVECEADLDCAGDDLPACDAGGVCVECVTDEDCDSDNPVCVDGECEEED